MTETGTCGKHGVEFVLTEGCPLCLAEKRGKSFEAPEPISDEAREILTAGRDKMIANATNPGVALAEKSGSDVEVINYYEQALKLKEYAEIRVIKTIDDIKIATDDLSIIARLKKAMEEKRKEYVKPLQEQVKAINDNYKLWMGPVEAADSITREKILTYNREQERIRREQEEINRKRLEAAEAEMKLKGELTESINLVEVIPEVQKRVSTEMGTTGTMKVRKWELADINLVPHEYLMPDAAKITKLVKAGIGSIPGIRIWEEETLRVNTR